MGVCMSDSPNTETGNRQAPSLPRTEPAEPNSGVQNPGVRLRPAFGVWLRDLLLGLAIAAFTIVFIYQPVKVEGTSMMPSLEDQERIFVNKFVYRLGTDFAGGYCGVSLPARSVEELY